MLTLNGVELTETVVGTATTNSQITENTIITVPDGAILTVRNPSENTTNLTLTPSAGGTLPVSARLVLIRLA